MARIRTIKPEMAKHEVLYQLERELHVPIRFAWAILPTQCDREGRFKWRPNALKTDILPYDDCDFELILDSWLKRGMLIKYRVGTHWFGWIPTFLSHQSINNREMDSVLPAPDKSEEMVDFRNQQVNASATRQVQTQGEGKGKEGNRERKKPLASDKPTPDPRKAILRDALKKGWQWKNPSAGECPWGAPEEIAMNALLADVGKDMPGESLVQCVRNKFLSDEAHGSKPRSYIRLLLTYMESPLDRFGKPKSLGANNGRQAIGEKENARRASTVEVLRERAVGRRAGNSDGRDGGELSDNLGTLNQKS